MKGDLIALNKTQINNDLMQQSNSVSENLFQGNNHMVIMSYNKHEMIGTRQQGDTLTVIKGECVQYIIESGID